MAQSVTVTATTAGTDTGPFTIQETNSSGTVVATGVTRSDLIAGEVVSVGDSITTVYVAVSSGVCAGTFSSASFVPTPTPVPVPVPVPSAPSPSPTPSAPSPTPVPVPVPVPSAPSPSPVPVPVPIPTPTPTSCYDCGDGTLSFSTSSVNYGQYDSTNVCAGSDTSGTITWGVAQRPNRFNIYSNTSGLDYTSGWKGVANYAGPWGTSLNTSTTGTDSFTFSNTVGRRVMVEFGGADPSSPTNDSADWSIACAAPTPTPTPAAPTLYKVDVSSNPGTCATTANIEYWWADPSGSLGTGGYANNIAPSGSQIYSDSSGTLWFGTSGWHAVTQPDTFDDTLQYISNLGIVDEFEYCPYTPPSPTPTPTPTPVPTNTVSYNTVRCIDNSFAFITRGYPSGTFSSGERVEGSTGLFYVITGTRTTTSGIDVTATGLTGCP